MKKWVKWAKIEKKEFKVFLGVVIMYLIYVLPIILADRYYNDDLGRSVTGGSGWNGDGRPLTEKLLLFLCGGEKIVDISPLPLLLGIIILGYAVVLYAKENLSQFESDYIKVMSLFMVIINPFMLTNLSYKYDVISMLLSLSLAFLAYSISQEVSMIGKVCWVTFLSICSLCLYQPAVGAFLSLALISILFAFLYLKGNLVEECVKVFGIGLGCIFYKLIIANHYISSKEDWRYGASAFYSKISKETFIQIVEKFKMLIFDSMKVYMSDVPQYILICIFLVYIMATVIMVRKIIINQKEVTWKVIGGLYIIILPILLFVAAIMPLVILETLTLRYRVLISFCICFFYIGIMALVIAKEKKILLTVLLSLILIFNFSYVYTFGNAIDAQKEYEKYLIYNIQHDIEEINNEHKYKQITISGTTPYAPQVRQISTQYEMIDDMITPYINNSSWLGGSWMLMYMNESLELRVMTEADYKIVEDGNYIRSNSVYNCYINEETIIIHFREKDDLI